MSKELIERLRSPLADCEGIGLCEEAADTIGQQAAEIDALKRSGSLLANIAFNLAQRAGHTLTSDDCDMLHRHRVLWDASLTPQTSACTQRADGDGAASGPEKTTPSLTNNSWRSSQ